jgi:uncharacterized protein with GYD domain
MTTYIALSNLTDAGIKAAKDSPRRLDAAKKLLADMGGEMKQFYMVMGEFGFVGICEAPDDAVMACYVLQLGGPRLRAHENAEGVPGDRLPRNHPLARLSRVGCSPDEHHVALLVKSPIWRRKTSCRSVQLPCRAAATTPRGTATDTEISRVRIISDRVGGMRCAIIETIDCPENKEFPDRPAMRRRPRCRNGSRKADRARG